jgi:lysophospholipase L1-like esterase
VVDLVAHRWDTRRVKRIFLFPFACIAVTAIAQDKINWHDITEWGVEGRGWGEQERERWFDRFPAKAEGEVTGAVWNLSRHSAGMMVRFKTDARALQAKWKVLSPRLGMPHMPPSGVSGLDLYARDAKGKWRWAAATRPSKQEMQATLLSGIAPGLREYAVYLPLYNGTESLAIGVPAGAKFERLAPRKAKPLIFYGTSITHGACASRPGMAHPAILGRRFDMPVINIGFSGNGKMHAAVGDLMAEVDAAAYIIDCLPNMNAAAVNARCVPLVKQLRKARPHTPIVLVEDRRNANSWLVPSRSKHHTANHAALRKAYEQLKAAGVKHLHYLAGDLLIGDDAEGTTDGSHPNDLGFFRQANAFEPVLRKALGMKSK